jgi:hypothetical protein
MDEKCCGCGKGFAAGDQVVTFRMEKVRRGEKSNQLGFYNNNQLLAATEERLAVDHVHFAPGCLELAFSPVENPFMFDVLADQVRQQIYDEESERDPAEILPDLPELLENPPYCLWCKRKDCVWAHFDKGYPIYNCLACGKLWDHEEDELYWDQEQGEYFLVP